MIRKDIINLFRVPVGKKIKLKDYNAGWKQSEEFEEFGKDAVKEKAKEVLVVGYHRARVLGRLHVSLRGCPERHEYRMGAVVRYSR